MIDPVISPRRHFRPVPWLATTLAATLFSAPALRAAVAFAGGELFLDTSLTVTHDSNIRGRPEPVDDTIFTLRPAAVFERSGAQSSLNLTAGTAIQRFQDDDSLDQEDVFADLNYRMPRGARTSGTIRASYFAGDQLNTFLNDRVDTTQYRFSGNVSYQAGGRLNLRLGAYLIDRKIEGFNNTSSERVSAGLGLRVRPNLSSFLDVAAGRSRSSRTTTTGFVTNRNHRSVSVGLDGEITPKLIGSVSIGYRQSDASTVDTGGDSSQTLASAELSWEPRSTTSVTIEVRSDPYTTGDGRTVEIMEWDLEVTQNLGPRFNVAGILNWRAYTYIGETHSSNDHVGAEIRLNYTPNRRFAGGVAISTFTRYAANPLRDFDRNTYSAFASVRF